MSVMSASTFVPDPAAAAMRLCASAFESWKTRMNAPLPVFTSRISADAPIASYRIVTGDYFLPDPIQMELKALGASIRFKPLWLEDLIALARTLVSA